MIATIATTMIPVIAAIAFLCSVCSVGVTVSACVSSLVCAVMLITLTIPMIAAITTMTIPAIGDRIGDGSDDGSVWNAVRCMGVGVALAGGSCSTGAGAVDGAAGVGDGTDV